MTSSRGCCCVSPSFYNRDKAIRLRFCNHLTSFRYLKTCRANSSLHSVSWKSFSGKGLVESYGYVVKVVCYTWANLFCNKLELHTRLYSIGARMFMIFCAEQLVFKTALKLTAGPIHLHIMHFNSDKKKWWFQRTKQLGVSPKITKEAVIEERRSPCNICFH